MKSSEIHLDEIKLVGISARTCNASEMNLDKAQISKTLGQFFDNQLASKIKGRAKPGTTFCVYTSYESDENGEYTYFVGEEVSTFENVDPLFETLTIPHQKYVKFDVGPGRMPDICIQAWQKIWTMIPADFGGNRAYLTDFELYDERAIDPQQTSFDLYIGIK